MKNFHLTIANKTQVNLITEKLTELQIELLKQADKALPLNCDKLAIDAKIEAMEQVKYIMELLEDIELEYR